MELKEYQQRALEQVKRYLELLSEWRKKAEANPDLEIDFPLKAWEKAQVSGAYHPRKNGLEQPLPIFCLKIPTGGGKTLLAAKTVDIINTTYLKKRTGLILWVVPTTQIYRQTLKSLSDREHPYRQVLDIASGAHAQILEKTDRFTPLDVEENLIIMMLMLPSASRQNKETLKVFRDSGGFQDFFPPEDDIEGQKRLLENVPNPWIAHELAEEVLNKLLKKNDKKLVANNFVFIIEEMRKHLSNEKDRLAQNVFTKLLESDTLRFLVMDKEGFRFPRVKRIKGALKKLARSDGEYLQKSLFEFMPDEEFNEDEKKVAWYLDEQDKMFFWFRNLSRQDYAIQGWKKHKIYPDFIFTAFNPKKGEGIEKVFVMETKGVHLKNDDTQYKELVFKICNELAEKRRAGELGLAVKETPLQYNVVYSDEWRKKINELLG